MTRYDPMALLDLRVEKWFTLGRARFAASSTCSLNSGLVLDRQNRVDSSVFNRIDGWSWPG